MTEAADARQWAAHPLDADSDQLFAMLENSYPIRLIATPGPKTCPAARPVADVLADSALSEFDYVPVVEGGLIIGLVDRHRPRDDGQESDIASQYARDVMRRLDETILISADDGILSFIETADDSPCRLVLERKSICGIVTISDLQRLPVRPLLFLLVTHVELLALELLRVSGQADELLMQHLSEGRRGKVADKWRQLEQANLGIDRLAATELCDKREILWRTRELEMSRGDFVNAFEEIEWLRNSVAHAGDYALTRENAARTIAAVKSCREWIGRLEEMRLQPSVDVDG